MGPHMWPWHCGLMARPVSGVEWSGASIYTSVIFCICGALHGPSALAELLVIVNLKSLHTFWCGLIAFWLNVTNDTKLVCCGRCQVADLCWWDSFPVGLGCRSSPCATEPVSVCRVSTIVRYRQSSVAVVDPVSQAAVASAGRKPSTVRRTTNQATTAALLPVHTFKTYAVIALVPSRNGLLCHWSPIFNNLSRRNSVVHLQKRFLAAKWYIPHSQ